MSGPGDRAFIRWAKRYISADDAKRVLNAYKRTNLIAVDNQDGTFRVLDLSAIGGGESRRRIREALEAAAENLRPRSKRKWNQLSDDERQRLVASKRSIPEQWERQERVELAMAKLEVK